MAVSLLIISQYYGSGHQMWSIFAWLVLTLSIYHKLLNPQLVGNLFKK